MGMRGASRVPLVAATAAQIATSTLKTVERHLEKDSILALGQSVAQIVGRVR
jgi:hypothetical protein